MTREIKTEVTGNPLHGTHNPQDEEGIDYALRNIYFWSKLLGNIAETLKKCFVWNQFLINWFLRLYKQFEKLRGYLLLVEKIMTIQGE